MYTDAAPVTITVCLYNPVSLYYGSITPTVHPYTHSSLLRVPLLFYGRSNDFEDKNCSKLKVTHDYDQQICIWILLNYVISKIIPIWNHIFELPELICLNTSLVVYSNEWIMVRSESKTIRKVAWPLNSNYVSTAKAVKETDLPLLSLYLSVLERQLS